MRTRIITLCYRKVVDVNSSGSWNKLVFEDSYREFKMQAQFFDREKDFRTFAQMMHHIPGAEQLHFLVSAAVTAYVRQLNETIPDIIDNMGRHFLSFSRYQFEIINSDLADKSKHRVAFNFYSEPLFWYDTIGNYLLVSHKAEAEEEILTNLVQLQPYLSIHSMKAEG